jgi:2-keto-4-pentenoate hydratase/2-oxohepta-3-ene-1,7-dioic acid hydratase in catechol pathway
VKLARQRVDGPDGAAARILAAAAGDDTFYDVRTALRIRAEKGGATSEAANRHAATLIPESLAQALGGGQLFTDAVSRALDDQPAEAVVSDPVLTNALDPVSYRDFMVFERHFSFGYKWQCKPVPEIMYELPISYAGDPRSFFGPGDVIPWPGYTERLDYELELGIVIGRTGTDLTPETALDHVLGLTILNDVSARDIQAREMAGGLGPSKGKHFACVTGPLVTSLDEINESGLGMRTRVNGETWCDTSSSEMVWSVAEIVAWASQGEILRPGALLGSGTCNGGSTVEIERTLSPGDQIELEIDQLGIMRNRLGEPSPNKWHPSPRRRTPDGEAAELKFLR